MKKEYGHGAVLKLTREDTAESIEQAFVKMRECGLNTVVVWPAVFWWEEKTEGYPYNTGRLVLTLAERHGLGVIMELAGQLTAMEYMPDFLMKPEYYPVDENGNRIVGQASFGYINYFHPEVKAIMVEYCRNAALAYRDYPALVGYDVFNETMFRSYDKYTLDDFRAWLREKYGTIEALNRVWERTYSDFSQIGYEVWKWMSVMPEADFCMWRREAIVRFLRPWCEAIRAVDDRHPLIADNIHSQVMPNAPYDRPQGDYALKTAVDVIGMSFYPKQQKGTMPPMQRWEVFDAYASAAGREGFYVSEMQTHIQALFNPHTSVLPNELKCWCMEAYAAGAKALIYWMWRPFTKGLQTLGRGIVNYRGLPTERFELVRELSQTFGRYGALRPAGSRVGILYHELSDDLSRRYTAAYSAVDKNFYNKSVFGAYKLFAERNVRPDVITIDELSNYACVVVTNACAMSRADAEKLVRYAENGGTLIFDGKVAVVDETSMLYDTIPGGGLHALTGEIYFESDDRDCDFTVGERAVEGYYGRDLVELLDAEVLGRYKDGRPALLKRDCGKGRVYTFLHHFFYGWLERGCAGAAELVSELCDVLSLRTVTTDSPLSVRISENDDVYLVFAFNYTDKDVTADVTVALDGTETALHVSVPAGDVTLVELPRKGGERA